MNFSSMRDGAQAAVLSFRPFVLFLVVLLQIPITNVYAGQQALAWDPVADSRLVGYMLNYGTASGSYSSKIDVGNATTYVVPNLSDGRTYFYAVTSYDASRIESSFSNEISATIPAVTPPPAPGPVPAPVPAPPPPPPAPAPPTGSSGIAFVQQAYATPQAPQASVSVTLASAQTAGNLNVVVVGWNDATADVTAVADSNGNVYTRAVGPTVLSAQLTQSIYYAKSIAASSAGTNAVTVQFNAPAAFADIRILEYSGLDIVNPVDVVSAASGASAVSSTPPVATTHAQDLLFAANIVLTNTSGAASGFSNRVITAPDGDLVEDQVVNGVGSYSSSAPLSLSGGWVMQMVAFKAATVAPPPAPTPAPQPSPGPAPAPGAIAFVQQNYATPQSPQATVSVPFADAQTAGNLNVVVVGWNDTNADVTSVTDDQGNVYTRAVGPNSVAPALSQAIYYAKNIASSSANSVTVQFNAPAVFADIRVVEYSGLDTVNPVDATATASGTGASATTATVKTSNASDLIFAANTVTTGALDSGAGFTNRVITASDGDLVEDRIVSAAGTYSATAPLSVAGTWVMQVVAFKAAP